MKQEYKYWMTTRETVEEYKYTNFATETASEIQVNKSVQRKLYSEMCISTKSFFFVFLFFLGTEWMQSNRVKKVEWRYFRVVMVPV